MTPAQQKYYIYGQELLALVMTLDRWRHLLCASKVTAYTDHQALTQLQNIRNNKPLRGRTARWLDFLAEFPHATQNTLFPAAPPLLLRYVRPLLVTPPAASGETTGQTQVYAPVTLTHNQTPLILSPETPLDSPSLAPHDTAKPTSPKEPPNPPTLTEVAPPSQAAWEAAYPKCTEFSAPFTLAKQQEGEQVQFEFRQRRHAFRFLSPYLYICIHGLWRICVPTVPEFLNHILYRYHDHVTAGHRGQKKTFHALCRQ